MLVFAVALRCGATDARGHEGNPDERLARSAGPEGADSTADPLHHRERGLRAVDNMQLLPRIESELNFSE